MPILYSLAGTDDLLDLIWGMQSKRMDEQRASLPESTSPEDEDKFFDQLIRSQVGAVHNNCTEI
jgi:hypothetical protein